MAERTRNFDWSRTPLGSPDQWPQSLRTIISVILNSRFPMFLWWGPDLIQFYNDAYRPSLGNDGKHPSALGQRGEECWPEIWPVIKPLIDQVLTDGEATWSEDQLIPIYRNGKLEDVYWTFGYSPVNDESGKVGGVLVVCTETTEKVKQSRQAQKRQQSILNFFVQAPVAIAFMKGPSFVVELANQKVLEYWGRKMEEVINRPIFEAIPEAAGQGFEEMLTSVLTTGQTVVATEQPVLLERNGALEKTYINFVYEPYYDLDGSISGVIVVAHEITEQVEARKKIEISEQKFRNVVEQAPNMIAIYKGEDLIVEVANDALLRLWQLGPGDINRPFEEIFPEMKEQGFVDSIRRVFNTGIPVYGYQAPAIFKRRSGKEEKRYFNFSFQPYREGDGKITGVLNIASDVTEQVTVKQQLAESETLFRNTVQQAPVAITLTRGEDVVVEIINKPMLEMMGKEDMNEVLGKKIEDVLPDIKNQPVLNAVKKVFATGETFNGNEVPVMMRHNNVLQQKFYNLSYTPLIEDGNITRVLHVAIDVTEQVLARQKVEASEQQVRTLIESAPFPIGVYAGREMRIQFANQTMLDVWGKGNDVIGKLYTEVLPELENQEIFQQLDGVFMTGAPFHAKNQRVDLVVGGRLQPYYFNYSFTPLFDADGRVYGVMNTGADVTDLNLARKKLEESESRFRDLVQHAPVAIAVFEGHDLVAKIANDAYLPLAGKTRDEFIGKPLFESLPETKELLEPIINNILETGNAFYANEFELRLTRYGNDEQVYFNFAYEPLKEPDGHISGFMVVAHEVTHQVIARKKIEESEAELQRRVEARTIELANTNEELKRSNQNLQEFAYAASHDMKEPIRKIHFFGDRLMERFAGKMDQEEQRYFDRMQTAARRMGTLIDDLLLYSHISRGAVIAEGVDLNELIKLVLEDLELEADEKGATITFDRLPTINGHKRQLQQLFQNLIGNALKYNRPGMAPEIRITCSHVRDPQLHADEAKDFYLIEVKDNGIGFEQSNAERIFNVFTRLHGSAEYRGTGVGLSIARKVVENHHGWIDAISQPGEGSTFRIHLPA